MSKSVTRIHNWVEAGLCIVSRVNGAFLEKLTIETGVRSSEIVHITKGIL